MSQLVSVVSTKNSSTGSLGANQEFVGGADDLSSFAEIDITLAGTPTNAPGTLIFEFSRDGVIWTDVSRSFGLSGPVMPPLPLRVVLPRFRVRYVNGGTPLTAFRLTTVLHPRNLKELTRFLDDDIGAIEPLIFVKSVLAGQEPDGTAKNVQLSSAGELPVAAAALPLPTGAATEATQLAVKRAVTDARKILFYDVGGLLEYSCTNLQTAAVADASWSIQRLFYDASKRLIDAQVLIGSVTGRAALAWRTPQGD